MTNGPHKAGFKRTTAPYVGVFIYCDGLQSAFWPGKVRTRSAKPAGSVQGPAVSQAVSMAALIAAYGFLIATPAVLQQLDLPPGLPRALAVTPSIAVALATPGLVTYVSDGVSDV